jgi:hypothetical protein
LSGKSLFPWIIWDRGDHAPGSPAKHWDLAFSCPSLKAVGLEPTTYGLKVPSDDGSCRDVSQIDVGVSLPDTSANDTERQEPAASEQAGSKPSGPRHFFSPSASHEQAEQPEIRGAGQDKPGANQIPAESALDRGLSGVEGKSFGAPCVPASCGLPADETKEKSVDFAALLSELQKLPDEARAKLIEALGGKS